MGAGHRETIDQFVVAFNAGDPDALTALCDPAVEIDSRIARAGGRPFRGHSGARDWLREVADTFDYFVADVDELREAGDIALAVGSARWRGKGSGVETREPLAWIAELDDGLMRRFVVYDSPEDAIAAFADRGGG